MKTETLVKKYERLRSSIPYISFRGSKYFERIAFDKYSGLKLTVEERTSLVNSECERLKQLNDIAVKEYHKKLIRLDNAWKKSLYKEFGVLENPKSDKCYSLAYEHGHSSGYSDIYSYFSEFVELI
jgi:hypothetical protein